MEEEGGERESKQHTFFNSLTFELNTPTCSSFWLSSSSSTAALYWPLLFGVAALNPPDASALFEEEDPGYAEKDGPPSLECGWPYTYGEEAAGRGDLDLDLEGEVERLLS
jgi:hypothetical protein